MTFVVVLPKVGALISALASWQKILLPSSAPLEAPFCVLSTFSMILSRGTWRPPSAAH